MGKVISRKVFSLLSKKDPFKKYREDDPRFKYDVANNYKRFVPLNIDELIYETKSLFLKDGVRCTKCGKSLGVLLDRYRVLLEDMKEEHPLPDICRSIYKCQRCLELVLIFFQNLRMSPILLDKKIHIPKKSLVKFNDGDINNDVYYELTVKRKDIQECIDLTKNLLRDRFGRGVDDLIMSYLPKKSTILYFLYKQEDKLLIIKKFSVFKKEAFKFIFYLFSDHFDRFYLYSEEDLDISFCGDIFNPRIRETIMPNIGGRTYCLYPIEMTSLDLCYEDRHKIGSLSGKEFEEFNIERR